MLQQLVSKFIADRHLIENWIMVIRFGITMLIPIVHIYLEECYRAVSLVGVPKNCFHSSVE